MRELKRRFFVFCIAAGTTSAAGAVPTAAHTDTCSVRVDCPANGTNGIRPAMFSDFAGISRAIYDSPGTEITVGWARLSCLTPSARPPYVDGSGGIQLSADAGVDRPFSPDGSGGGHPGARHGSLAGWDPAGVPGACASIRPASSSASVPGRAEI
jgi:hypothetical protein